MKSKDIKFYLEVAKSAAKQSSAIRLQVGAVIVDRNEDMVAFGYNGTVRGHDNSCESKIYSYKDHLLATEYPYVDMDGPYRLVTNPDVIHAEMNTIAHAARRGISINGGTIFITHSPCIHCIAMLIQCGIQEVIFLDKFRDFDTVIDKYRNSIKFTHYEL